MQCRFCLENGLEPNDVFVEPCACRGSVQYVHKSCLRRWIEVDPLRNGEACTICGSPFLVAVHPIQIHIVPTLLPVFQFILTNIGAVGVGCQIIFFAFISREDPHFTHISVATAGLIHEIYVLSFIRHAHIQDYPLYIHEIVKNGLAFLWCAHAFLLYVMVTDKYMTFSFVAYALLDIYWGYHRTTIARVNEQILGEI